MNSLIAQVQGFLCEMLFCLPQGTHPWDYLYHLTTNFGGVIVLYLTLTRILKSSPKTALFVSILFLCVGGAAKEIEDIRLGAYKDTWKDVSSNLLGITLSTIVVTASRARKSLFIRRL